MIEISAAELVGLATCPEVERRVVSLDGAWGLLHDDWAGCLAAFSQYPGAAMTFHNVSGPAYLELLQSSWSGILELSSDGQTVVFDAFSETHRAARVEIPGTGTRSVTLKILPSSNPAASGKQLWIWRLVLAARPAWARRERGLTPTVDFVEADQGDFLTLTHDDVISRIIRVYGVWGQTQVDIFRRYLGIGGVAVDVGANLGHHTVTMGKLVGPTGRVYAFEPQRRVFRLLTANLALNHCDHVEAYEVALGNTNGSAVIEPPSYDDSSHPWNVGGLSLSAIRGTEGTGSRGVRVDVRVLDEIVSDQDVQFIKSDAQGFDYYVLKGAVNLIRRCFPTILVEIAPKAAEWHGADYLKLYQMLQDFGYRILDPETMEEQATPRKWSGQAEEEWDVLAVHPSRAKA